jgi:pilus assembly protein Flp/PilA
VRHYHSLTARVLHPGFPEAMMGGTMRNIFRNIQRSEGGATAVEYGLICALIVLAMIGTLTTLGGKTTGKWNNIASEFNNH